MEVSGFWEYNYDNVKASVNYQLVHYLPVELVCILFWTLTEPTCNSVFPGVI